MQKFIWNPWTLNKMYKLAIEDKTEAIRQLGESKRKINILNEGLSNKVKPYQERILDLEAKVEKQKQEYQRELGIWRSRVGDMRKKFFELFKSNKPNKLEPKELIVLEAIIGICTSDEGVYIKTENPKERQVDLAMIKLWAGFKPNNALTGLIRKNYVSRVSQGIYRLEICNY